MQNKLYTFKQARDIVRGFGLTLTRKVSTGIDINPGRLHIVYVQCHVIMIPNAQGCSHASL